MNGRTEEFVELLTANQPSIFACILSLLPDRAAAQDVLQETNVTLWNKANDFQTGSSFVAWASRIARNHVLNHRRKSARDRLIFDEAVFQELCERQAARIEQGDYAERAAAALKRCLSKLPEQHVQLLTQRYAAGGTVKGIASRNGQSTGAISQMLYRIRESLLECVSRRLKEIER